MWGWTDGMWCVNPGALRPQMSLKDKEGPCDCRLPGRVLGGFPNCQGILVRVSSVCEELKSHPAIPLVFFFFCVLGFGGGFG